MRGELSIKKASIFYLKKLIIPTMFELSVLSILVIFIKNIQFLSAFIGFIVYLSFVASWLHKKLIALATTNLYLNDVFVKYVEVHNANTDDKKFYTCTNYYIYNINDVKVKCNYIYVYGQNDAEDCEINKMEEIVKERKISVVKIPRWFDNENEILSHLEILKR